MMVKLSNENDHCKQTNQTPWFQFLTHKKKKKKKEKKALDFYSKKKKNSLLFIYLLETLIEWKKNIHDHCYYIPSTIPIFSWKP